MASWWQKTLVGVAGLAGLAGGAYFMLMRRPLPKVKGELSLKGLHDTVEVITDRYGVPHIYAQNEDDLFFAQGYIHAQDRLWQMEFNRRLGMHRAAAAAAEQLPEHSKRIFDAYAQGVNAFIEHNRNKLPIEFILLR